MRPFIALYVGGMGSRKQNFYNQLVQRYGFEADAQRIQDLYLEGKREEAMAAIPDALIDTVSLCGPSERGARAPGRLPRRGRRHARRHPDRVHRPGAPRAAAPAGRARRLSDRRGGARLPRPGACCSAPSATPGTRSR